MTEYKVMLTDYAMNQISSVVDYISDELRAPETAEVWLEKLKSGMETLAFMPDRVLLTDEEPWRSRGIRKLIIMNYYIYFWINRSEKTVWIIAVIYSGMDQATQLKRIKK